MTLEEKRALICYTTLNLVSFVCQILFIVIAEIVLEFKFIKLEDTPVTIIKPIFYIEIAIIVVLEIFFIILP